MISINHYIKKYLAWNVGRRAACEPEDPAGSAQLVVLILKIKNKNGQILTPINQGQKRYLTFIMYLA